MQYYYDKQLIEDRSPKVILTLALKLLNANDCESAAGQFERWVYANGKVLDGLKKRRKAEKELFLKK